MLENIYVLMNFFGLCEELKEKDGMNVIFCLFVQLKVLNVMEFDFFKFGIEVFLFFLLYFNFLIIEKLNCIDEIFFFLKYFWLWVKSKNYFMDIYKFIICYFMN